MRRFAGLITAGIGIFCLFGTSAIAQGNRNILQAYRDRNRVLLVFAPSRQNAQCQRQSALLDSKAAGLNERDLILIYTLADGKSYRTGTRLFGGGDANALRRRFGVTPRQFRVVLIGKDGHEAYSANQPISAQKLFGLIDAMPMRRDEVRRRQRK